MFEKTTSVKAQNAIKTIERELNSPLSISLEILIYLRHRKDRRLATVAGDAERDLNVASRTVEECFAYMKTARLVREVPIGKEKGVIITDKGIRLIFEGIRPIFNEQENIVEKVLFRQTITHNAIIEHDILTVLRNYGEHTSKSHKSFFKSWISQNLGDYPLFDEWIRVFNEDYAQFSKADLKEFIEKNLEKKAKEV